METIGEQIARWRRAKGFRQTQLESMAGLGHNTISRIENGQVSPRLATIERIASALCISYEELQFRGPPEKATEVREEGMEYLVNRMSTLAEERRESILCAFNLLLDQVEGD